MPLKKSFLLRFAVDGAGRAAMLVMTILLARIFDVPTFGRFAFALSFVNLLYFLTDAGSHLLFLREMGRAGSGPEGEKAWGEFFGLKLTLTAAVGVGGGLLAFKVWPWEGPLALVALVGWMLGNTLVDFLNQACNAANRVADSAGLVLLHRGSCLIFALAALLLERSLLAVSLGFLTGSLLGAAGGFFFLKKRLPFIVWPRWQPALWLARLKSAMPLALASLFGATYVRLGLLMLPWYVSDRDTGLYGAANKLFEAGYMVPAALMALAVPQWARTRSEKPEAMRAEVFRLGKFASILAALWLAGGQLLAPFVVRALFGAEYLPAVPVLRVLVLVNVLVFFNYFLTHLLVVYDRLPRHLLNETYAVVAGALGSAILISNQGAMGAAWALLATEAFLLALTCAALRPTFRNMGRETAPRSAA